MLAKQIFCHAVSANSGCTYHHLSKKKESVARSGLAFWFFRRQKRVFPSVCSTYSVPLPPLLQKFLVRAGAEVFVATLSQGQQVDWKGCAVALGRLIPYPM